MNINKLGVGQRLAFAFSVMLAIMVVLALLSLSKMATIQEKLDRIVSHDNVKVRTIMEMRQSVMNAILNGRNIALMSDAAEIEEENKRLGANRAVYADTFKRLEALLVTAEEKAALEKITATRGASVAVVTKMAGLVKAGGGAGAAGQCVPVGGRTAETRTVGLAAAGAGAGTQDDGWSGGGRVERILMQALAACIEAKQLF